MCSSDLSVPRFQPFSDRFERIFTSALIAILALIGLVFIYKFNLVPQGANDGFYRVAHLGQGRLTKEELLEITSSANIKRVDLKIPSNADEVKPADVQEVIDEEPGAAPKLNETCVENSESFRKASL